MKIPKMKIPKAVGFVVEPIQGEAGVNIPSEGFDLEDYLEALRTKYVKRAMTMTNQKQTKAAELLKMSTRSLRYLLDKYKLK